MTLVLASASPRRRELLSRAGVHFDVLSADVDETPLAGELPRAYAARVAAAKAEAGMRLRPGCFVLAADTIVVVDGAILGKPVDAADAAAMLARLSGRTHEVLTATCLLTPDGQATTRLVATEVHFTALSARDVDGYIACGEWRDKAGGYAAQGIAAAFITQMRGSYTNVVGLPLAEVLDDLRRAGAADADLARGRSE